MTLRLTFWPGLVSCSSLGKGMKINTAVATSRLQLGAAAVTLNPAGDGTEDPGDKPQIKEVQKSLFSSSKC